MNDASTVKDRLLGQVEAVCFHLFPQGKRKGREFTVGSLNGEAGGSLSVNLSGGKAGVWKDFATGETGDIYKLWMGAKNCSFKEAFEEACKYVGFTHIDRPKPKPKPPRPSNQGMVAVKKSPVMEYLQDKRGISPDTAQAYKVFAHGVGNVRADKNGVHGDYFFQHNKDFMTFVFIDSEGEPVMLKSTGINKKKDGKKDIWSTQPYYTLWGWWTVTPDTREIIITEGEIDAMSIHQLDPGIPVLSMPSGSSNLDWIENDYDALNRFEKVYICTDNDDAGNEAAKQIAKRLGLSRCMRVPIPGTFKDANEALLKAEPDDLEIYTWMQAAYSFDPPTLQGISLLRQSAHQKLSKQKEQNGESTFLFPGTSFNFCNGTSTLLEGYKGHGKSEFLYQSHIHEMAGGRRVCVSSLEIPPEDMLINMATQIVGHLPTPTEFDKALDWLDGKLWFYNKLGKLKDWRPMLTDFEYCAKRFGCEMFIVDSLHFVVKKDDYEGQDEFAVAYDGFAKLNNVHSLLVAHARIKKGEHMIPNPEDVLGSSGILVPFHNVLVVWRNKTKVDELEKANETGDEDKVAKAKEIHDGVLALKFKRADGKLWQKKMWFNPDSKQFRLKQDDELPTIIETDQQEEMKF